ncbi:MAG: hypothetical protein ACK5B6_05165 [Bacteroidia bacterium]|jgi:hypothetical protein
MKHILSLTFLWLSLTLSGNVSKVFICAENESFGATPVHGSTAWTTYIGTSKLAFAKGYTYKMKIEYSGLIPPGTIGLSNDLVFVNAVERSGNVFTFKIEIPSTTNRLSTFQIGFRKTGTTLNYPIACEVVEIGKLFSMTLQDSSNTTMTSFNPQIPNSPLMLVFLKQTGKKHMRFYGSALGNIRFNSSLTGGQAMGLTFNSASYSAVDNTNFKLTATVGSVSATGGQIAEHILGRLIDNAADKHYPWVTYKYAAKLEGSTAIMPTTTQTGGTTAVSSGTSGTLTTGTISTTVYFTILPGQTIALPNSTEGYYNFMSTTYSVN